MRYKVSYINYNIAVFSSHEFLYKKTLADKMHNASSFAFGTLFSLPFVLLEVLIEKIRSKRKPYSKMSTDELKTLYREKVNEFGQLVIKQLQRIKEIEAEFEGKKKSAWESSKGQEKIEKTMIKPSVVKELSFIEDELYNRRIINKRLLVLNPWYVRKPL